MKPGNNSRKREGLRYETCRECGNEWNVSRLLILPPSGYLCPVCLSKIRAQENKRHEEIQKRFIK